MMICCHCILQNFNNAGFATTPKTEIIAAMFAIKKYGLDMSKSVGNKNLISKGVINIDISKKTAPKIKLVILMYQKYLSDKELFIFE